jgi:alpha-aminoadipic semialdehyde synthase
MIGIRREDKNEWERRVALTPDHVAELSRDSAIELRIQPSAKRAFPDIDYAASGAVIADELSECDVILGIKEIPIERLVPSKTHMFFSHTTKGQDYSMPMLREIMRLGCTLIDYEQIVNERGKRLIFFGKHAGYAGMIDGLWALGKRLEAEGHYTGLEQIRLAHEYSSLDDATHHISRIGEKLRHTGLPETLRPLVCGFTGSGNVSRGAQEIFDRLPTLEIDADDLDRFLADPDRPRSLFYKVVFNRSHRFIRNDGAPFDANHFDKHPELYSNGLERWLPQLTMLVHGAFWAPEHPRTVSFDEMKQLWSNGQPRLKVIADISCDIHGGIEATVRPTTPGAPTFLWDVHHAEERDLFTGDGPLIMSVDNLPCQLAAESSEHFGDTLVRWVPQLDRCDWSAPLDELKLPAELRRAIVVHRGQLTPDYRYLNDFLKTN